MSQSLSVWLADCTVTVVPVPTSPFSLYSVDRIAGGEASPLVAYLGAICCPVASRAYLPLADGRPPIQWTSTPHAGSLHPLPVNSEPDIRSRNHGELRHGSQSQPDLPCDRSIPARRDCLKYVEDVDEVARYEHLSDRRNICAAQGDEIVPDFLWIYRSDKQARDIYCGRTYGGFGT